MPRLAQRLAVELHPFQVYVQRDAVCLLTAFKFDIAPGAQWTLSVKYGVTSTVDLEHGPGLELNWTPSMGFPHPEPSTLPRTLPAGEG